MEEEVFGNPTPLFYHQSTEIDPELQVVEWVCKRILAHQVVGDSWEFLTEWEGAEDSPTWEPPIVRSLPTPNPMTPGGSG